MLNKAYSLSRGSIHWVWSLVANACARKFMYQGAPMMLWRILTVFAALFAILGRSSSVGALVTSTRSSTLACHPSQRSSCRQKSNASMTRSSGIAVWPQTTQAASCLAWKNLLNNPTAGPVSHGYQSVNFLSCYGYVFSGKMPPNVFMDYIQRFVLRHTPPNI